MYWILKTEKLAYSFDQLKKDKNTIWDGVRNYQARNNLRKMKKGELALIYHSVTEKEIVGIATIANEAFVDPSDATNTWLAVSVAFDKAFQRPVTLLELKSSDRFKNLSLIKQSRLSVCPITKAEYEAILALAKG